MATPANFFKPGNNFGARSKRPKSKLLKEIRENTADDICAAWSFVSKLNIAELQKLLKSKTAKGIILEMASARIHAIKKGDFNLIDKIFNRILGNPKIVLDSDEGLDVGIVFNLVKEKVKGV